MGVLDRDNDLVGGVNAEAKRRLVAWNKATPTAMSPDIRLDAFGSQIKLDRYGDRYSEYGWEVDYIVSLSDGGSDTPENWRALHWRNMSAHGGRTREFRQREFPQTHR